MIIYVNDYDVGIEALPTPTITLLLLLLMKKNKHAIRLVGLPSCIGVIVFVSFFNFLLLVEYLCIHICVLLPFRRNKT